MVAEGVKTARLVLELADRHGVEMPIARHIHDIIEGKEGPIDAFAGLLPPGHELEAG
jgi:glycerol-3-phosphate dehydrogenase (NAD(P)+)